MANSEDIQKRIIDALKKKTNIANMTCPVCGKKKWQTGNSYIVLPASKSPTEVTLAGKVYPVFPIFCKNCGNTQLINLLLLGFSDDDFNSMRID